MIASRVVFAAALVTLALATPGAATPEAVIPIGQVQGAVSDAQNGLTHRSPFAPASGNSAGATTVTVQAVVTELVRQRTSTGGTNHGIFIQNTAAQADGDPTTSDGIFVFMGGFSTLLCDPACKGGSYTPRVGDEIRIRGRVSEFFNLTQLSSSVRVEQVVAKRVAIPAFGAAPPDDLAAANRYWERRESMLAQVPAGSVVTGRRDVFASTADGEVWVIRGDHPVAQRANPFTRRVFRDAHPLDNVDSGTLFDDGNGYRIIMGSHGLKGVSGDNTTLIAPARTFDTMTNSPTGAVYFSFSKYQIMVDEQPALVAGVDPATNEPPQAVDRASEWAGATFNVENLYDFRDDPFDGCDFTGNAGCPGVRPPFDYVPASDAEYQERLGVLAHQIAVDAKAPDVILVQEAEDQDICTVTSGALSCGTTNNADGKPDTLQELALRIGASGGPAYDAAYDRDGADDRGIVSGFLYRTDRVQLLPASASDPVLGSSPTVVYDGTAKAYNSDVQNPKVLNADMPDRVDVSTGTDGTDVFTRAPQVGLFRIWRDAVGTGQSLDVYLVSNHFSSTPDARVGQRREQALYNARIVGALESVGAAVMVGGDLNVYPRPDDPFAPPSAPSDQLGPLYEQGLANLYDRLVAEVPISAYAYVFQGQAQTLDQIFVTSGLLARYAQVRVAHVNADWPADHAGDGPRGASDHDLVVARFTHVPSTPDIGGTMKPPPGATAIQFVTVSDWHGQLEPTSGAGGAAFLKRYFDWARAANPNTLVFMAGDSFGASPPISSFFEEEPAVRTMNMMGIDADTLGNHNFDRGVGHLQRMVDLAEFPFVSANLDNLEQNVRGVETSAQFTLGGIKVAVIGITNEEAPTLVSPGAFGTIKVTDSIAAANKAAAKARAVGAQVVVILTHKGIRGFDSAGNAFGELVDFADGIDRNLIDVVVGDHTNFTYSGVHQGKVLAVENLSKGVQFARIQLAVDPEDGIVLSQVTHHTPTTAGVAPDPGIQAYIDDLKAQLAPILGTVIGSSTVEVLRSDSCGRSDGRLCESKVGNVVTDALRSTYGTDFAITNSGGLRAALTCPAAGSSAFCTASMPPNSITRGGVLGVLPFGNVSTTVTLSGAEVDAFLENGVSRMPSADGRFPQVSGLCFTYDVAAPAGNRVGTIVRQAADGSCTGLAVLPTSAYTVTTNDFMANGGDGYPNVMFKSTTRNIMDQDVSSYISASSPISPSIQGRIVCADSNGATSPNCPAITAP